MEIYTSKWNRKHTSPHPKETVVGTDLKKRAWINYIYDECGVMLCCALGTDGKNTTLKRIHGPVMIFVCASCNILVLYLKFVSTIFYQIFIFNQMIAL